jgi:1-phosphofructokinase family hexose kinase
VTGSLVCVSLAPSLDRYLRLPRLAVGAVNRPSSVVERAGGKGLNVARTARALGVPVRSLVLAGGGTGERLRRLAEAEGLAVTWVDGGAETRQCSCLLDETTGELTEVYEPVRPVFEPVWPRFVRAAEDAFAALGHDDVVVVSGRVPAGMPADALGFVVGRARSAGAEVLVDSDGPHVRGAIEAGPDLLKVNHAEAARAAGHREPDPWAAAGALRRAGARSVVVTLGGRGAVCLGPDGERLTVVHDPVPDPLPVGSGDAFTAGWAAARLGAFGREPARHGNITDRLRLATATARANTRVLEAGDVTAEAVAGELGEVRLTR